MPGSDSTNLCSKCGDEKYHGEFHVRRRAPSGRAPRCKICTVADKVEYRANQVTSDKEQGARYRETYREKDVLRKKRWAAGKPEKIAAHVIVKHAVKMGALVRPDTCSQCKTPGRIEGHHPDYSEPLDIIWLCRKCHIRLHAGQ